MKNSILPTVLFSFLVCLGISGIYPVIFGDVQRVVGVNVGDFNTYRFYTSFNSSDPSAEPGRSICEMAKWLFELDSHQVIVQNISRTNITCQVIVKFKNGTQIAAIGWIDVADGGSNLAQQGLLPCLFTSANLTAGDRMYSSTTDCFNETIPRAYLGVVREVNHNNVTMHESQKGVDYDAHSNMYYDKLTGSLLEYNGQITCHNETYFAELFAKIVVEGSSVVPEYHFLAFPLFVIAALLIVTLCRRKQSF